MSKGCIKILQDAWENPAWGKLSLKHQNIFQTIIQLCDQGDTEFDDLGVELQPGQICISIRDLQEKCHVQVKKIDVERALKILEARQLLRQEVRHRKSVIILTYSKTYENNDSSLRQDLRQKVRQSQDHTLSQEEKEKEESIERRKRKRKINSSCSAGPTGSKEVFFSRDEKKFINFDADHLLLMEETFPKIDITEEMRLMRSWLLDPVHSKRKGNMAFIRNWLRNAIPKPKTTAAYDWEENLPMVDDLIAQGVIPDYSLRFKYDR